MPILKVETVFIWVCSNCKTENVDRIETFKPEDILVCENPVCIKPEHVILLVPVNDSDNGND